MRSTDVYVPGVCNIGPAEIRRRLISGWIGVAIAGVFLAVAFLLTLPAPIRLLVVVPVGLAAGGFLQGAFRFCANFGMRGLFNFGALGVEEEVYQAEYRRKDQRKAVLIVVLSLLIAIAAAVGVFLIPFP